MTTPRALFIGMAAYATYQTMQVSNHAGTLSVLVIFAVGDLVLVLIERRLRRPNAQDRSRDR